MALESLADNMFEWQMKNALIMAHYYTEGVIQELADFVGDSLALAQKAATTDADIIVMCTERNKIYASLSVRNHRIKSNSST